MKTNMVHKKYLFAIVKQLILVMFVASAFAATGKKEDTSHGGPADTSANMTGMARHKPGAKWQHSKTKKSTKKHNTKKHNTNTQARHDNINPNTDHDSGANR